MDEQKIISATKLFVQNTMQGAEGGHDWFHILRVYNNAKKIAATEPSDMLVVELGALLHDIADSKFHDGDETIGPEKAKAFLQNLSVDEKIIEHTVEIIRNISFKGGNFKASFSSPELSIVQDADRLDAMGAIGIARAFNYGGYRGRAMYDPAITPDLEMTTEAYKKSTAPTINHFYEKLLRLKEVMNTSTGKKIAEERHQFMLTYLQQFYGEWLGEI